MISNKEAYVVPMNYGFEIAGEEITLYFHSASEGRKLEALRHSPNVCFETDKMTGVVTSDKACEYGATFESFIGWGVAEFIADDEDKIYALNKLMSRFADAPFDYDPIRVASTTVFRVKLNKYSAKERKA
jgi:nitroimidazol reductase NimA-like FMN-containing flavoprotein (pyridoxamine 5'-phosphate oxidase superfamily)